MAGRHSQQEPGGASKFSPRKFSEKIALLNKKEAEGNAEFEEIIKEVQATTKRGAALPPPPPLNHQVIVPAQNAVLAAAASAAAAAAAAQADDELEEVYQNLMSCQYDEDKDIVDSSSEVSSSARDQIEDIERSIRAATVAPVVVEHRQAFSLPPSEGKFSGPPVWPAPEPVEAQGYCRVRGTSVGSNNLEQPQESSYAAWQAGPMCNDYLKPNSPERLQWQKSSSDPALNSASLKLASPSLLPQPNQPASFHGSCSENYIQVEATASSNLAAPGPCYSMLEQRQDLPGIKICAIEDLEATSQLANHLGPPLIVHGGGAELEKANSSLPDIAKLQFSGSSEATVGPAPAEQHPDMNQWSPLVVRPSQMEFAEQQQQQQPSWIIRAQVSPASDLGEMFEAKPVNSLLSSSDCGLQFNHLNQSSNSSTNTNHNSAPGRRHHHHQLSSSVHQQRLRAASQDQIIRSHSHNNISYVTKQRRQNCNQSNQGRGHQHHHHLQHLHQHQRRPVSDYEHHMGQFGLQVGCPRHLEGAKSGSSSSVRPQYGSVSPINSPASQPTSPQSENQSSPAGGPDSYLPYSCSVGPQGPCELVGGQPPSLVVEQTELYQQPPPPPPPQELYRPSVAHLNGPK